MIYHIEYTYPQQDAIGSLHSVEAVSEKVAMYKAQAFIAEQLYYRFDKDIYFEIGQYDDARWIYEYIFAYYDRANSSLFFV